MDPAAVEARRLHILRKLLLRKEAKRAASLLTFGRVLLEGGQAVKSIPYFEEAARLAPSLAEPHFRLSLALRSAASSGGAGGELDASIARQVACLSRAVVIDPCFSPAWCNLSALEMRRGQHASALACAQRAVALSPELSDAHYNVGSTLRRLGRQDEAIELAWRTIDGIRRRSGALGGESAVLRRAPLDASRRAGAPAAAAAAPAPALVFVCVKWGTKYGAEYVNKLRHGVRRHCDAPHAFVCFTDDAAGLDIASGIIARPLPTGCWHTWWLKATLFGGDAEHAIRAAAAALRSTGGEGGGAARGDNGEVRALYVDLDSIIVGSLDALTRYSGDFATLGTEGFVNEGREGGFNSSVMLWSLPPRPSSLCGAAACEAAEASAAVAPHIYAPLARDFETITKVVHRFDHWLEMNIVNAALLQDFAPGVVVEFRAVCTETLPPEASLVTFPLQPKPHDFPAPWVAERWIMDSAAPADAPSSALPRALPAPTMPSISPMPPTTPIRRGPDFVIVGAMKGGTESIVAALRRHEEVWMPAGGVSGETHMFDRSVEKRSHLTVEAYCAYFAEERERANVRFVGEKSPVYMHRASPLVRRGLPTATLRRARRSGTRLRHSLSALAPRSLSARPSPLLAHSATRYEAPRAGVTERQDCRRAAGARGARVVALELLETRHHFIRKYLQ